jgi:short subunit dehydrogenase-like uncharacterized protein
MAGTGVGARTFDLVIWGATGFTGELAATHLARRLSDRSLRAEKFAIAGRDAKKLSAVKEKLEAIEPRAKDLHVLVGEADNADFLADMLQSTRVVLTYVGPYTKYGLPLARGCVKYGTDYCDITGEANYQKQMVDELHDEAKAKGVTLITACGYDSVPFDIGTYGLIKHLRSKQSQGGTISIQSLSGPGKGGFSGGTLASGAYMKELPSHVLDDPYDEASYPAVEKPFAVGRFHSPSETYLAPNVMEKINEKVIYRTRGLLEPLYGKAFVWQQFMGLQTKMQTRVVGAVLKLAGMVVGNSFLKGCLLRLGLLPKPGEGPSEDVLTTGFFNEYLYGKLENNTNEGEVLEAAVHVRGTKGDPGYMNTSAMSLYTALCLSKKDELGSRLNMVGGVLTPASCMGDLLFETMGKETNVSFSLLQDLPHFLSKKKKDEKKTI